MKYLFIGAHVDDVQLSCGGTVRQLVNTGHDVTIYSLSMIYQTADLSSEFAASLDPLGVENYIVHNFETRHFLRNRQDILDTLFQISALEFDYVFTSSVSDMHSDHSTLARETIRAFKHTNILSYMGAWNTRHIVKNYFVTLNTEDVMCKLKSLECFDSQRKMVYMKKDNVMSELRINGMMCGAEYAEAFEVVNLIV